MIEKSDKIAEIAKALLKAQPEIDIVAKNAKSHHGTYADFTAVVHALKKPLNDVGVLIMQAVNMAHSPDGTPDKCLVETALIHAESGQYLCSNTPVCCKDPNDPQKLGSGITYAKRYGLQAMGLLPSEDDDGKAATKKPRKAKSATLPEPNEQESAVIQAIVDNLTDIASEAGRVPSFDCVKRFVYETRKGSYNADMASVDEAVKFIAGREEALIAVTTKAKE